MFIFKNALCNLIRTKGRTVLISVIVIAIAVASSIAMAINNAAVWAKQSELENKTITGSISVDREKMMQKAMSNTGQNGARTLINSQNSGIDEITLETLEKYADSSHVQSLRYTDSISASANSDAFQKLSSVGTSGQSTRTGGPGGGFGGGQTQSDFTLTGYSSADAMTNFTSGAEKIVDGEIFEFNSADYNCAITKELADYNKLSVGSTFTVGNPNNSAESYTLKVVGIYKQESSSSTSNNSREEDIMSSSNNIFANYKTVADIQEKSKATAVSKTVSGPGGQTIESSSVFKPRVSNTFVFNSKSNYDAFVSEVRQKGLSEDYTISSADISNFESELVPLENLSKFTKIFLLVVLLLGAIILSVINIFNIRERKYEIGVLTAIGISKPKVITQFVVELLAVTIISIVIGTGIGATASVPVANALLSSQVEAQKSKSETTQQNFGRERMREGAQNTQGAIPGNANPFGTSNNAKYIDKVNATVNLTVLLELIGIGILLVTIASIASAGFVVRYEPLQILADRN
ncbi:MAG: ABC transporter permease [Candidatus Ancillula sp.]|jgi:putative ABC transport system permease protein|nr:ABC transporter permease [Candidatus Ancillula sp.]